MADDPARAWRHIRQARSSPYGLAAADLERATVFQTALAQAEELWKAASIVSPASRPLPLFYCLSQAARAVCAAWNNEESWRPEAHGLGRRVSTDPDPGVRIMQHAARVNQPERGSFSKAVQATASQGFNGYATVAQLWASLPGFPTPNDLFGEQPRCITLQSVNVVEDNRPVIEQVLFPQYGVFGLAQDQPVRTLPARYPSLAGLEIHEEQRPAIVNDVFPTMRVVVKFPDEDGALRSLSQVSDQESERGSGYIVRPGIGTNQSSLPSQFLTMTALLYCLSELARYYPDTWVTALDPDSSRAAVTLEHGLELALNRAPKLISGALSGPIHRLIAQQIAMEREEHDAEVRRQAP